MKVLNVLLNPLFSASLSLFAGSAFSAPAPTPLDFEKVNASIKIGLMKYSAETNGNVNLMYALDPAGTNIDKDQYAFKAQLRLAKTSWSNGSLDAVGNFSIKTDLANAEERGFTVAMDTKYTTDAVSMLVAEATAMSPCGDIKQTHGVARVVLQRHCEYVGRLAKITAVDDLQTLLLQKVAAHKQDLAGYIASLQAALAQQPNQQPDQVLVRDLLSSELDKSQKISTFLTSVKISKTDNGFVLDVPEFQDCPILAINGLRIAVEPNSIAAKGSIHFKFGKSLYAAARPVVLDVLRGLENGDEASIKIVKYDAALYTNLLTSTMSRAGQQ